MTGKPRDRELLRRLLADDLPPDEERAGLEELMQSDPPAALSLLPAYLQQKHRYRASLDAVRKIESEAKDSKRQPPWHPATFLRFIPGPTNEHALVVAGNRRLAVEPGPEVNPNDLRCGRGVLLSHDMTMLLRLTPDLPRPGLVSGFSRWQDGRVVVSGPADEEMVLEVAEEVREAGLKSGDLLLYDHESLVAYEKVEKPGDESYLLERVPDVTFADVGGLDDVIEEIVGEFTLHFFHSELVRQHRLAMIKGVILYGPPGVGKTMLARALANYFSCVQDIDVRFLNVKPGAHRSMWYGRTEENVRELFAVARRAAADGFVVMFFDDIDQLGGRDDGAASAIDARVLPAFLEEIDGLESLDRVLLIGATNRPDLLDMALRRPGRFGDRVFAIPRPNREAAREIFRKHLAPDLPYYTKNGSAADDVCGEMIEAALAAVYSPNGEASTVATLTFRDGSRAPVTAAQVMSGAIIANIVTEAKKRSCLRALRSTQAGITMSDVLGAIDRELDSIAQTLKPGPALQQMLGLPSDLDVVKVEVRSRATDPASHEYLRLQ